MQKKVCFSLALCLCCCFSRANAQTLDWNTVKLQVLRYHPVARQGQLVESQAKALRMRARGGFDPKAFAGYSGKSYQGKNYFQFAEAGVKLPTWAGIELKGAYNYANGLFLNPENKLPKPGQASLGLEWSLGQGLLFDERRAGLLQADAEVEMYGTLRAIMLNNLVFDASKAYWAWVYAQEAAAIATRTLEQAKSRHIALKESFLQGEKPAIDTLESFIAIQGRVVDLQFARTDAQNASIELSRFLWDADGQAILPATLPAAPPLDSVLLPFEALKSDSMSQHFSSENPELLAYSIKLKQLSIENRLKKEKQKPVLDLSYYLLGNGWTFFSAPGVQGAGVLANDVKWGIDFSIPLPNRKARGDIQLNRLKMAQTELEMAQKNQDIRVKMDQYANEFNNLRSQATLFQSMADNYQKLLDAENEKFKQGESSIFLVITREQRWLDAQLKWLKLQSECKKAEAGYWWAKGAFPN